MVGCHPSDGKAVKTDARKRQVLELGCNVDDGFSQGAHSVGNVPVGQVSDYSVRFPESELWYDFGRHRTETKEPLLAQSELVNAVNNSTTEPRIGANDDGDPFHRESSRRLLDSSVS
jgi:hypothetical protein